MPFHLLNTDDPAALRFVDTTDIRAFLTVYRSAVHSRPWAGVGDPPKQDPEAPHARVEAWLDRLSAL